MIIDSRIDPRLVNDLENAEHDELTAYRDSLGIWTIGRGHKLPLAAPGQSWAGFTITQAVSDRYLVEDALLASRAAQRFPEWASLDSVCRQNAVIELCFNMGAGTWGTWGPTRALIQQKNWGAVHDHLLASLWASQVQPHRESTENPGHCSRCGTPFGENVPHSYCKAIENGRAERLANYILTGEYPS